MTRMKQTAIGAALVASLLLAAPVQAAQCVDQTISSAARIQELKILLMNVSLRCRVMTADISSNFDRLVKSHVASFDAAERDLRTFFGAKSSRASQAEWLRYNTVLGNIYGAGNTNLRDCRSFNGVMTELSVRGNDRTTLLEVASGMVPAPRIEGDACQVVITAPGANGGPGAGGRP